MTDLSLETALDRMMTCARAFACPREEACFVVVRWARERHARDQGVDLALEADAVAMHSVPSPCPRSV